MSISAIVALLFTVIVSIAIVAAIILLGWFLIWKAFLSKFRLVRELLGQGNGEEQPIAEHNQAERQLPHIKQKKVRKD